MLWTKFRPINPVVFGLCFAIIVLRTRNLFASSVIHGLLNSYLLLG